MSLATPKMRAALRCGDPDLNNYFGSRFERSSSTQSGINEPVFHLSAHSGTMFAMQLGQFAAYTLNYHHSGEPKSYTVIKPRDHEALEDVIGNASIETLSSRAPKTPSCSQFVRHQAIYVPHKTLQLHGIEYTTITQYQGEMVIIFPYAYHQGFNAGPNITEEIMYASDRWEVFHREKLYQDCSRNCAAKKRIPFNLDFVHQGILSRRSNHRRRLLHGSPYSPSQGSSGGSPTCGAEEEELPSSRQRCKALCPLRLRAMDDVSHEDGEYSPEDDDTGGLQLPKCKSKRGSSGKEADIWSVDSILEAANDEARSSLASRTNLNRSRDSSLEDFEYCVGSSRLGKRRRRSS